MQIKNIEAVILHREDCNEVDKRIIVFSRELGKLRLVARGVRRPKAKLRGHLELFNLVKLQIAGRTICGVETIDSNPKLRENIESLETAFYIASLVVEFSLSEAPDHEMFNLVKYAFSGMISKRDFNNKFLEILGFGGVDVKDIKKFLRSNYE